MYADNGNVDCNTRLNGNYSLRTNGRGDTDGLSSIIDGCFAELRALLTSEFWNSCALGDTLASEPLVQRILLHGGRRRLWWTGESESICDFCACFNEFVDSVENRTRRGPGHFDRAAILASFGSAIDALRLIVTELLLQTSSSEEQNEAIVATKYDSWLEFEELCSITTLLSAIFVASGSMNAFEVELYWSSVALLHDTMTTLRDFDTEATDTWIRLCFGDTSVDIAKTIIGAPSSGDFYPLTCDVSVAEKATDESSVALQRIIASQDWYSTQALALEAVLVVFLVFVVTPLIVVNANRTTLAIYVYHLSFENKELELKKEKQKTEAVLNEMLPRFPNSSVSIPSKPRSL